MKKKFVGFITMLLSTFVFATTVFAATSELTGLPISDAIATQRPVAIMVDNEKTALPHYGTAEADIVYEMMNSTANGRITRLMCIYKDWTSLKQTGSIRSTRTTNVMLANEYNAVLVHDGGPFYINTYLAQPNSAHLSGGFTRVNNGKPREFTEYVFGKDLTTKFASSKIPTTYTGVLERNTHFLFNAADTDLANGTLADYIDMSEVFKHNGSKLVYNAGTKTYDYYEYTGVHQDAEDKQTLTFKNVILQDVPFVQLDVNGYLTYDIISSGSGYYATNGKAIPITWIKTSDTGMTHYFTADGKELKFNVGKTYIGILPADTWNSLKLNKTSYVTPVAAIQPTLAYVSTLTPVTTQATTNNALTINVVPSNSTTTTTQQTNITMPTITAQAGGHEYGGHLFTNDEWNCLLAVWDYTGHAEEMITHHSVNELKIVLDQKMTSGARSF